MAGNFIPPTKCPKCGGTMEEGIGIDKDLFQLSSDYVVEDNEPFREHWQKAVRTVAKAFGRSYEGYRKVDAPLAVIRYRCVDCGYLESYAPKLN